MSEDLQPMYRIAPAGHVIFRDDGGQPTVQGLVVPYGQWSEVDSVMEGHFMERFKAGSLRKTFSESLTRMRGFFEHGRSRLFASTPIMDITRTWETDEGAHAEANLLDGLPDWMIDGLRRGLYGFSLGARPVKVERNRRPRPSAHNPKGLEERTYLELRAHDISLTPQPHYAESVAILRSITDELAVEKLVEQPERLLQLLRQTQAEPTHSEPEAPEAETPDPPDDPETVETTETEEKPEENEDPPDPEPEGSRATQPPHDYLTDEREEDWRL